MKKFNKVRTGAWGGHALENACLVIHGQFCIMEFHQAEK
jgi:hypothetical protein